MAFLAQVEVRKIRSTEKAVLITNGSYEDAVWLPKSQIEINESDTRGLVIITLPEWLAAEKELI